jgi:hypothetical protein
MSKFCIIGDLHGRTKTLQKILKDSESKGEYYYVFIGDLIHHKSYFKRTKKSSPIKILRFVKQLSDQGRATLIRGNNEQYVLDDISTPLKLIKNVQVRYTIECLRRLSMTECDSIIKWLNETPLHLELENLRLAHAYYPKENTDTRTILSGPGYPWFKRDHLSDHLDPDFTYLLGHYGYPFIKQNLKIIDATLFEGVGVYYTDLDEFMVYY